MPKIFLHIINLLLVNNHPDSIIGDTEEEYIERASNKGHIYAMLWLVGQIIFLVPLHFSNSFYWSAAMLKNYFKIGFRNLIKEKLISIISIAGLGIGIAAAGLIMIYVHFETSYDNFFTGSERIYRMYTTEGSSSNNIGYGVVLGALTPVLKKMPDVESATSIYNLNGAYIKIGDKRFDKINIFFADSNFFEVLDYEITIGSAENSLSNPSSAIITESTAIRFWGTLDVVGNDLEFQNNFLESKTYRIAAVIKDTPLNSHLEFNILLSHYSQPMLDEFGGDEFLTYFKLNSFADHEPVLQIVSDAFEKVNEPRREYGYEGHAGIIPIEDINLKGASLFRGNSGKGDLDFVIILSIVAAVILLIAVLNFINLLSAKFQNRFNEIAVRKVVGANRNSIVIQFISEAVLIACISSTISIVILLLTLTEFGVLVDRKLDIYFSSFHWIIGGVFLISTFAAVAAAIFPALRVANLKCVNILKNKSGGARINRLIPLTVTVQFAVVIILISSIAVIYSQVEFMKNQKLGFDPEQLVYFNFTDSDKFDLVKSKLEQLPDVISVTGSQSIPGFGTSGQLGKIKGVVTDNIPFNENRIQTDFIKTFGMKLLVGREFNKDLQSDRESVILNEKFVKIMNLMPEEALERKLERNGIDFQIIGVVADFNYASFEQNIAPLTLSNYSDRINIITAKIKTNSIKNTLNDIEKTVKESIPDFIFDYSFVDEIFGEMYKDVEINNTLLFLAALLAIALSVMGLFAVTLFAVLRRTKEIGIRKVLGSSVSKINLLLLKDYIKWVVISNIIALPAAHYLLSEWLQNYTVRIDLNLGYYLFAGFSAMTIAFITVIYITSKAALANPVKNLRYE